jgi:hypothetical protein
MLKIASASLAACVLSFPAFAGNLSGCSFDGIELKGDVEIVDSFPDVKVQIVDSFADLHVQMTDSFADGCGEWKIVDSFPDFKVQYVDSFPDVTIKVVDSFPGAQ